MVVKETHTNRDVVSTGRCPLSTPNFIFPSNGREWIFQATAACRPIFSPPMSTLTEEPCTVSLPYAPYKTPQTQVLFSFQVVGLTALCFPPSNCKCCANISIQDRNVSSIAGWFPLARVDNLTLTRHHSIFSPKCTLG